MPLKPINKPEKKDFKQELLERINQQYGPASAAVMDKALKNQDKQLDEAMLQGGMTIGDIAKSQNIDWNMFGGEKTPEQTPQTQPPTQQMVTQKPASSPLGFGGMSIQDGQFVEQQPGLLAGILSTLLTGSPKTSANMDLAKLLKMSEIKGSGMEQERLDVSKERLALEKQMEERRVGAENRRQLQDTKNTIYSSGAELTEEDLQNPDIAKIVNPLIKQNNIEPIIDPDSGMTIYSIPPKEVLEKTRKEVAAINLKRKELSKELSDYFAVGDSLPTAEGLGRFEQGAKLYAGSIFQTDQQGAMAAQLNGLNKRLRVKLVRAAGDVGNLNIVEQGAAEKLLYNFSDSTNLRTLKKAFLMDLSKALDNNDQMEIKKVVNKWMKREGKETPTQGQPQVQQGWTQDKESRYQELLKKRGR